VRDDVRTQRDEEVLVHDGIGMASTRSAANVSNSGDLRLPQ
jgi:hypothetical protein